MIDVTVIVVTYNSEWKKLRATLLSILMQQEVDCQIIVADDGSVDPLDQCINDLMNHYAFDNYKVIHSPENRGTVKNLINGIQFADGKYTKSIAPGDLIYDPNVLKKWFDFMELSGSDVSFGDAIFYTMIEGFPNIIDSKDNPIQKKYYKKNPLPNGAIVDYLLANDTILGAGQIMKTTIMKEYLKLIEDKIKYAEDYMIRIMIFNGRSVLYFPQNVVWYEYGTGISTSKDSKWDRLLHDDFEASNKIIVNQKASNSVTRKYKLFLEFNCNISFIRKILKVLMFPSVLFHRIRMKNSRPYKKNADIRFLKEVILSKEDIGICR